MTLLALAVVGRGVVSADEPVLHADDEGLLRGRAVFETVRVYAGRPFRLPEHLERLGASAARVGLPEPNPVAFEVAAREVVAASPEQDAVLRLLWTPGREGRGEPLGLAFVSPLPGDLDELRARGLRLASVEWPTTSLAGAKSTSYAANLAARDLAMARGCDDALLLASDGVVLESPTANVWWREGARLLTPSLELPILRGVTRAAILDLATGLGYDVEEGAWGAERLLAADEAFLSSSIREVMPVVEVDGTAIGAGSPGPAATALQAALREAAGV